MTEISNNQQIQQQLHRNSQNHNQCKECERHKIMISRYEQLVSLYKKKKVKNQNQSSSEMSSQLSQFPKSIITNSEYSSVYYGSINTFRKNKLTLLFTTYRFERGKKLATLRVTNCISRKCLQYGMNMFKNLLKNKVTNIIEQEQQIKHNNSYLDKIEPETLSSQRKVLPQLKERLRNIQSIFRNDNKTPKLSINKQIQEQMRINIQLHIHNQALQTKNKQLQSCIEQLKRRQTKQNLKKKESLEMLAEQLNQKNVYIKQLKLQISAFHSKNQTTGNVLEDESIVLRRQVQYLDSVKNKLNDEVQRFQDKVLAHQKQKQVLHLKLIEQKNQNFLLQNRYSDFQLRNQSLQRKQNQVTNFLQNLHRKVSKIVFWEKYLEEEKVEKLQQLQIHECKKSLDVIKSEILLYFLSNISFEEYQLRNPELFTIDQKTFLLEHKSKYIKLENQVNILSHPDTHQKYIHHEIDGRGRMQSDMFEPMDISKDKQREQKSGITMKIIEMEIDKAKLVQKISETKEKLMHIRILVLNLLKNLQLEEGSLKSQTQSVLRVVFQIFEYSEDERQSMIQKKKKFFRFL